MRFCNGAHYPSECTEYETPEKRSARIKQKMLCFNCFGKHKVSECRSKCSCRKCKRRHCTTIFQDYVEKSEKHAKTAVNTVNKEEEKTHVATMNTKHYRLTNNRNYVLLKTTISTVSYGVNTTVTHMLLDERSQKSFITCTEEIAQRLKLTPCETSTLSIAASGDTTRNVRNLQKAAVQLETDNQKTLPIEVLIVPTLAAPLTNRTRLEIANLSYLKGLKLAHSVTEEENFEISSMLIGADFYWYIVENEIIRGNGPTAVKSKL